MPTIDQLTAGYIQLRDAKKRMAERHKLELEPINDKMKKIESWFLKRMNADGVDSYAGAAGTPYRVLATNVKIDDWELFSAFARENDIEGMATHGVSKKEVREWIEENGRNIPGLTMTQTYVCNVKGSKK